MQLIDETLTTLKTRRDELDGEVQAERARIEERIAEKVAELNELNGVIRAIERKQGAPANTGNGSGTGTPRGVNRDKILAVIGREPRTVREISDATDIGGGSANRTLKQLEEAGEARKTDTGWIAVPARK